MSVFSAAIENKENLLAWYLNRIHYPNPFRGMGFIFLKDIALGKPEFYRHDNL
jgi:hypothetical protein